MKRMKQKEVASFYGTSPENISTKKKAHPSQYEIIRLGSICKKNGINEEVLLSLIEMRNILHAG